MYVNEKIDYDNPLLSMRVLRPTHRSHDMLKWHYHKETEIIAVLSGTLEAHFENGTTILNDGDLLLIGPYQLHRDRVLSSGGIDYVVLQFDPAKFFDFAAMPYIRHFADTSLPLSSLNYIVQEQPHIRKQILESALRIHKEETEKQEGYEIAIMIEVQRIFLLLLRHDNKKVLLTVSTPDMKRLKPVLDYIESNIGNKVQVEDSCRMINMSYYYFVKYFKRVMGMSFTDYVNFRKIKHAERILLTQDHSVSYVGELIGMPNMAHFYKIFRKFNHCSPNEYRKNMKTWQKPVQDGTT
ncbi:AraC family transcriptional regulator [Xylanibacillus composti]|uniref:HTH araC/xylS-type domain-containing protein n=1 Tax=Xylanibacillus composti TaxID=1572762 RepID=A0A8J4H2M5_9BACL|nr:AraC family transcriptional regulator [Xylanibacillus composti]MDT9724805.1 AraC family transcriptional regulator [Xylanibacillus composti]GIQ69842.1 hypothetical protein XYCOK13_26660 [Xylanibacillus composti]